MSKVSVIIPVYNVEKYLRACLDSVVNQTLRDIEIICVDDGSTDSSPAILAEYAAKDPRVKVVTCPHTNAGAARNAGMAVATGEYLGFVDSDDWCELTLFEKAYGRAVETDADLVFWRYQQYDSKQGKIIAERTWPDFLRDVTSPFSIRELGDSALTPLVYAPWGRLVSKDLVRSQGINFQELPRFNDVYFCCTVHVTAGRAAMIDEVLYTYRVGRAENLQSGNKETPNALFDAWAAVAKRLEGTGQFLALRNAFVLASVNSFFYVLNTLDDSTVFENFYRRLRQHILTDSVYLNVTEREIPNRQTAAKFGMLVNCENPLLYLVRQSAFNQKFLAKTYANMESAQNGLAESQRRIVALEEKISSYEEKRGMIYELPSVSVLIIGSDEQAVACVAASFERQTLRPTELLTFVNPSVEEVREALASVAGELVYFCLGVTPFQTRYGLERRVLQVEISGEGIYDGRHPIDELDGGLYRRHQVRLDWAEILAWPEVQVDTMRLSEELRIRLTRLAWCIDKLDLSIYFPRFYRLICTLALKCPAPEDRQFLCRLLHETDFLGNCELFPDADWPSTVRQLTDVFNQSYEDVALPEALIPEPAAPQPFAMAPDLTIIVPVYNAGRYLIHCIESLRHQSLSNIEILCVNDGSTDSSAEILDRFAARDGRIIVYHRENAGVSESRNFALEKARGRYVCFVDGDDWMDRDFARSCVESSDQNALDVCYFDIAGFDNRTRKSYELAWSFKKQEKYFPFGKVFAPMKLRWLNIYSSACCAVYNRSFLLSSGCRFPKIALGEDAVFVYSLLPKIKRAMVIRDAFYHYRRGNVLSAVGRLSNGRTSVAAQRAQMDAVQAMVGSCTDEKLDGLPVEQANSLKRRVLIDLLYYGEHDPRVASWLRGCGLSMMHAIDIPENHLGSALYARLRQFASVDSTSVEEAKCPPDLNAIHSMVDPVTLKRMRRIEEERQSSKKGIYLVCGQLNSRTNEPIDSWTFFRWLQDHGIPSRYLIWKEHSFYALLKERGEDKDVIALSGDGVADTEFLSVCKKVLPQVRAFLQENGALNYRVREWMRALPDCAHVFLQHGVFFTAIEPKNSLWMRDTFNYVNVASVRERNFIVSHLPPGEAPAREFCLVGGLPRWDALVDRSSEIKENVILVMLTWRASFNGGMETLSKSAYFNRLRGLLSSERVERWRKMGAKVVLVPHHHLANMIKGLDFGLPVEMADPSTVSYWIRHAKMLLTDISSVSIDFMFQHKPTVFWVLDHDDPNLDPANHDDGGKVLSSLVELKSVYNMTCSLNEAANMVERYIRNGFVLEPEKRAIADTFFAHKKDICRHVYEAVEAAIKRDAEGGR